jgi:hypothetical protein
MDSLARRILPAAMIAGVALAVAATGAPAEAKSLVASHGRAIVAKPPAKHPKATKPGLATRTGAQLKLDYPINITNEHFELDYCSYSNGNWNRVCQWNYFDAGGYFTNRVAQYQRWDGRRYVSYAEVWCSTGGSGVCYTRWL